MTKLVATIKQFIGSNIKSFKGYIFDSIGCHQPVSTILILAPYWHRLNLNIALNLILSVNCCNLSAGVALVVWFTTNGMCAKNNNTHAWSEQAIIREIVMHDLYCCLLPLCEALRKCHSGFPIATKWCCDQDVEVVPSSAFTQRTCDRCGLL